MVSQRAGTYEQWMSSMMAAPIVGSLAGNVLKPSDHLHRAGIWFDRGGIRAGEPTARQRRELVPARDGELSGATTPRGSKRGGRVPWAETAVVDELRQLMARADALASTTSELFNHIVVPPDGDDRRGFTRLARLIEMTALGVSAASEASSKLIATLERDLSQERA